MQVIMKENIGPVFIGVKKQSAQFFVIWVIGLRVTNKQTNKQGISVGFNVINTQGIQFAVE
jgi:hypothetical protein